MRVNARLCEMLGYARLSTETFSGTAETLAALTEALGEQDGGWAAGLLVVA